MSKQAQKVGQVKVKETQQSKTHTQPAGKEPQSFSLSIEIRRANGQTQTIQTLWVVDRSPSLLDVTIYNPTDITDQTKTR
jgi:hypothetical protein